MKRTNFMVLIGVVLLVGCAAVAQMQTREIPIPMTTSISGQVKVWVPFQFTVGDKDFNKGSYYFTMVNDRALSIKSTDNDSVIVVNTNSVASIKESTGPRLVFHRYGDRIFLAQTWSSYSESGRELYSSPEEVKLARIYSQQQIVLVAKK